MRSAVVAVGVAVLALSGAACAGAALEETTPHGYVIAPSVPADAGGLSGVDGAAADQSRDVDASAARR